MEIVKLEKKISLSPKKQSTIQNLTVDKGSIAILSFQSDFVVVLYFPSKKERFLPKLDLSLALTSIQMCLVLIVLLFTEGHKPNSERTGLGKAWRLFLNHLTVPWQRSPRA